MGESEEKNAKAKREPWMGMLGLILYSQRFK